MRKLVLLRGAPGAGKSTLLRETGLEPYALSMDHLRLAIGAPVLGPEGRFALNQDHNAKAFALFRSLLGERLARGELIAVDGVFADVPSVKEVCELARGWRYEIACVDFSSLSASELVARNASRGEREVPAEQVERFARVLAQNPSAKIPALKGARLIPWVADGSHKAALDAWLRVPELDFNRFEAVAHIGDLQGCLRPLTGPGGLLERGFQDRWAYVFVGDLFDRGLENGRVGRWFVDEALPRENVFLLWGNHEHHLHLWARGLPAVSEEFELRTLPQLLEAGLRPADAEAICAKAREALVYRHGQTRALVTHGGLSGVPERLERVSLRQLCHGTGKYSDPVDQQFERNAPEGWVQAHGHRNHGHQPIRASERSFNLEDAVEHGGHLRSAILTPEGWREHACRNTLYRPARERSHAFDDDFSPAWMQRSDETRLSAQSAAALRAHSGVREKSSASAPHVSSFHFSEQVFQDRSWDELNVKARGLFVDQQSLRVVARGYDKFFTIQEAGRPEMRREALAEGLSFPVALYVKENGFLGNVGYDERTDELFVASKSTPDGQAADLLRDLLAQTLSASAREGLRRWLRDHDACLVFEAIDPLRDPHLIDYAEPRLVLLDVFHRSERAEKLPYAQLRAFARHFGLQAKSQAFTLKTPEELFGWLDRACKDLSWRHQGQDVEGFVFEDANGFQGKVKLPHYSFWKSMRSSVARLAELRAQRPAIDPADAEALAAHEEACRRALRRDAHPLARAFLAWADEQPDAALAQSVLALRARFLAERGLPEGALSTPWERFDREAMSRRPKKPRSP
jgi:predicted kinase